MKDIWRNSCQLVGRERGSATDTYLLTKSKRREMKTTLSTLLRVAASTDPAMVVLQAT